MRKSMLTKVFCLFMLISFLFACKKDSFQNTEEVKQDNTVLAYIKSLGYKDSQIKEAGGKYIVDGDIVFYKDRKYGNEKAASTGGKGTNQASLGRVVSIYKSVIIVRIDPTMSAYTSHITDAIAQWNNAGGRLKFYLYNGSGGYDINIVRDDSLHDPYNSNNLICGQADYPSNGYPHYEARINIGLLLSFNIGYSQIQRTICHEIGHTIGLVHTNELLYTSGASLIPGTPMGDTESLMNGGECGEGDVVLSYYDKLAFRVLYPAPYSITGPVSFCSSATYSANVPIGASITWSTTGPMSIVGSSTSSTVNVVKTSDTYAYLNATIITAQGEIYILTPAGIILGASSYIPHEDYAVVGDANAITGAFYTYHMPAFPGAISYSWDVSGGTTQASVYNNNTANPWVDVKFNSPGYHSIYVTVTTECGLVSLDGQQLEILVTSGY